MTAEPPPSSTPPSSSTPPPGDPMTRAVHKASSRDRRHRADPGPSMGTWLGQIGVLGWITVSPMLLGLVAGRWLDWYFGTGLSLTPPFFMIGAGLGMWSAWRWMQRRL
ncbi:AtpZ/AtpI family protein [Novosphingobium sp. ZN18A2]|uniref:AtpZ/AtpI family protein n=1 Tax=Novosphingobium sp. ZN18A2 TaxID=3079861 RepID=UPI0030D2850C